MNSKITLDQGLRKRRSIRHYEEAEISDRTLQEIIEHASWAPSPGNTQAWKVVILNHRLSLEVIRRFETPGWESVFPVLRQVMQTAHAASMQNSGNGNQQAATDEIDWNTRALQAYHEHFEVRGTPRLIFIYRTRDLRRYANLFRVSFSMLLTRSGEKKSLVAGILHFLSSIRNVPTLMRVNALTRVFGLANFTYAITLAAYSRGLSTCIQSNYMNVQRDLKRFLGLGSEVDIVASVLIGRGDRKSGPPPEIFLTRRPVEVRWVSSRPNG